MQNLLQRRLLLLLELLYEQTDEEHYYTFAVENNVSVNSSNAVDKR